MTEAGAGRTAEYLYPPFGSKPQPRRERQLCAGCGYPMHSYGDSPVCCLCERRQRNYIQLLQERYERCVQHIASIRRGRVGKRNKLFDGLVLHAVRLFTYNSDGLYHGKADDLVAVLPLTEATIARALQRLEESGTIELTPRTGRTGTVRALADETESGLYERLSD